tara:strand:+ start:196 stop:504 length:309 start_codon:yes stop_codon:yes gene_type:complete
MYYSGKEELNKKKDTYSSVLSNQGLLFCILLRPSLWEKKEKENSARLKCNDTNVKRRVRARHRASNHSLRAIRDYSSAFYLFISISLKPKRAQKSRLILFWG